MSNKKGNKKSTRLSLVIFGLILLCICGAFSNRNKKQTPEQSPVVASVDISEGMSESTIMPTVTQKNTPTEEPKSIHTPTSGLSKMLGKIWTGVQVYYGNPPEVIFTILGGNDSCSLAPSNRGLYVEYPDGTKEWKDREYILTSGYFFVESNDPAISKMEWKIYPCE